MWYRSEGYVMPKESEFDGNEIRNRVEVGKEEIRSGLILYQMIKLD